MLAVLSGTRTALRYRFRATARRPLPPRRAANAVTPTAGAGEYTMRAMIAQIETTMSPSQRTWCRDDVLVVCGSPLLCWVGVGTVVIEAS